MVLHLQSFLPCMCLIKIKSELIWRCETTQGLTQLRFSSNCGRERAHMMQDEMARDGPDEWHLKCLCEGGVSTFSKSLQGLLSVSKGCSVSSWQKMSSNHEHLQVFSCLDFRPVQTLQNKMHSCSSTPMFVQFMSQSKVQICSTSMFSSRTNQGHSFTMITLSLWQDFSWTKCEYSRTCTCLLLTGWEGRLPTMCLCRALYNVLLRH